MTALPVNRGENALAPRLLTLLLRHRVLIVYLPLLIAVGIVGRGAFQPRSFTSEGAFMPVASTNSRQALAGLAAQIGVSLPTQEAGQSPQFYIDLMRSRPILEAVATTSYTVQTDTGQVTADLVTLLRSPGETPAIRLAATVKGLNAMIGAVPGLRTGVVTFTVKSRYSELSQGIAKNLLDQLDVFNQRGRGSRAKAERKFVEARLLESRTELSAAEEELMLFTRRNRTFGDASELTLNRERLQRTVSARQQVYTSLMQAFEQAKLEEVRDTPVLAVIVPPSLPATGDTRGLAKLGLMLLVSLSMVGGLIALTRDYVKTRGNDASFQELRAAWQSFRGSRRSSADAP